MKITVIGTGYVGLISAVGWAHFGHAITCVDLDAEKIGKINKGIAPIYEPDLDIWLQETVKSKKILATVSYSSVSTSDIVLISVGTPSLGSGEIDLKYIRDCAEQIAQELSQDKGKFVVIIVRSTVLPGTTEEVVGQIIKKISGKKLGVDFGLAMIPEFLKEGTAIADFNAPDRIVIGTSDERTKKILEELHSSFKCPKVFVNIKTAEMIKYTSNAFLATKISFTNEMAGICERLSIDVDEVMRGTGLDARIGPQFLVAGAGFGGSCFPKDVKAIRHKARGLGISTDVLDATLVTNEKQQAKLFHMLKSHMLIRDKTVAVLGLAFKAGTDDIRDSPAIIIITKLIEEGAKIRAYDPKAMENMRKMFPSIAYSTSLAECVRGADAVLLVNVWPEFIKRADEYKQLIGSAIFLDARRILDQKEAKKSGLEYHCIGRG